MKIITGDGIENVTVEPFKNGCCKYCNNNCDGLCCADDDGLYPVEFIDECDDFHDWIMW